MRGFRVLSVFSIIFLLILWFRVASEAVTSLKAASGPLPVLSPDFWLEPFIMGLFSALFVLSLIYAYRKEREETARKRELEESMDKLSRANRDLQRELYERLKAEQSLKESKAQKKAILDGIPTGLTFVDRGLTVMWANRSSCQYFGLEAGEVLGRKCHEIFASSPAPCPECPARKAVLSGTPQKMRRNLEGNTVLDLRAVPVTGDQGYVSGVILISQDITERLRLEENLAQSHKMEAIGTLAGGIAHDFNNILAIVSGNLELAQDDIPQQSPVQLYLAQALAACSRARDLVRQILGFSRRAPAHPVPTRFQSVVEEALSMLRPTLPANIEIRKRLDAPDGLVLADPTQISQVLINLATNAEHAMRDTGGRLTVELDIVVNDESIDGAATLPPGEYVRLVVSDTGPGIESKEVRDRIFDPYFTTKARGDGTGLGLSVVHSIVREYGGEIFVDSEAGNGATFSLYFPRTYRESRETAPREPDPLPRGSECILFVDDEPSMAAMARQTLERLGYQVAAFSESPAAVEAFQSDPAAYDMIITDQTMPQLTGAQVIRRVKDIRPEIPVLLCTGFSETLTRAEVRRMGVHDLLLKPIRREALAKSVRAALDSRQPDTPLPA